MNLGDKLLQEGWVNTEERFGMEFIYKKERTKNRFDYYLYNPKTDTGLFLHVIDEPFRQELNYERPTGDTYV
jgi:hypothetical protein